MPKSIKHGIILLTVLGAILYLDASNLVRVDGNSEVVEVKITEIDKWTKGRCYIKFTHNSKESMLRVGQTFCKKFKVGDLVQLNYSEEDDRYVRAKPRVRQFYFSYALFALALFIFIYYKVRKTD